jgi:pyridoxamine 5'-phosphate oxidase
MSKKIAHLRQEYALASLSDADLLSDPIDQFKQWFDEAMKAEIEDVNAMALSTVDAECRPSSRIVLLKGIEQDGFVFFTNYHSYKGRQIEANPNVSLLFHWKELQRQVRIEGVASRISEEESTAYFKSRPRESQLGALASFQSEPLASRKELEDRLASLQERYAASEIPKPPHWGGYVVKPLSIEFWQGRMNRLHDRFCYTCNEDKRWTHVRLNP